MTFTHALSTNNFGCAKFIVDGTTVANGTHSTIAAALTSASSGDTIFIRPGTYTENLTLKAGVNLASYNSDAYTPNVTISGTCTLTAAGICSISGICLQTNGANSVVISGANQCQLRLINCFLSVTNNTGISFSNSNGGSQLYIYNCRGDITTTGIAYLAMSSPGKLKIWNSAFLNEGSSSTSSTVSSGGLAIINCQFLNNIDISGGAVEANNSQVFNLTTSITGFFTCSNSTISIITTAGTGTSTVINCLISGGSSTAISVGAGTTLNLDTCTVDSSNTNAISGAGTLNSGGLTFSSTSSTINTTTQTIVKQGPSATFGSANSGGTNTITATNTSNTASSNASIVATVGGTSAADAFYQATVSGTTTWSWGVDNSDSDAWVLSASATPGTTNVMRVATTGEITYPLQPAFEAYLSASVLNVTGDGTTYTILFNTEQFDQNGDFDTGTGIFTAPVSGRYQLSYVVSLDQLAGAHTSLLIQLNTSNITNLQMNRFNPAPIATGPTNVCGSFLCDMDAADTARIDVTVSNGTKVVDVVGTTGGGSFFSGFKAC